MEIRKNMIAAIGCNRELGRNNELLWHIPEDLAHFKNVTHGAPVIMGKATFFSLPEKFRPLPGRTNIVLAHDGDDLGGAEDHEYVQLVHTIDDALRSATEVAVRDHKEDIFVIGGASIYTQMLADMDRLYLTLIDAQDADADVFFPEYGNLFTREVSRQEHDNGTHRYTFVILEKGE